MDSKSNSRLTYFLVGAIAICILGLAYQYVEIRSLRLKVLENRALVDSATRDAAAAIAESEKQKARIESLEHTSKIRSRTLELPLPDELEALLPGLYELETSTQYDPDIEETSPYTITHVVVELSYDDYATKLHVGMATSGWIPKGVYFDYDNDGRIDTDMAMDFVRDIPMVGPRLAKGYDPDSAQNLYGIFVRESENAEHTSINDMADDAEAAPSYIWKFVMNNYKVIEAWVLENLPETEDDAQ